MRPSESGMLAWLNVEKLGTADEVVARLMEDAKIMVNSGIPYGQQGRGHIRIVTACYASDADAQQRFDRIRAALLNLAKEKGLA